MYLTQKNHIRGLSFKIFNILQLITKLSKNLFNITNYIIREYYNNNNKFLRYESAYHLVKENENYKHLPSQVAQQTMKIVDRSYRSFFSVLQQKRKGNYDKQINIPKFLPKNEYFLCIFQKDSFKIIGNKILISLGNWINKEYNIKNISFVIPTHIIGHIIKEIRILPKFSGKFFEIEYVYLKELIYTDLDKNKIMGVDLGINNFATCSTNKTSFIIEGKGLKSYNCWWNKNKAKLQSIYAINKIKYGKKMYLLNKYRNNKINEFINQSINYIIKHCIKNKIGNIVIGELKYIKHNLNLGHKNNQHFAYIPYNCFKQKLKSKCELYGIKYYEINEAYTSQTCSNCGRIKKSNRIYRGLYKCDVCNNIINADVNGAINIANKVASESEKIRSSGIMNIPKRIKLICLK